MDETSPALDRLEKQLRWYSEKSSENKKRFQWLKVAEIAAAALIPFIAGYSDLIFLTGLLGVFIVILEGFQSLFQFHDNWISYRSTSEALKREKYLWQSRAGHYKDTENPDALLAERVEALVSREHVKWVEMQEQGGNGEKKVVS